MGTRGVLGLATVAVTFGCSTPEARTPRMLDSQLGVLVTNSPMLAHPAVPERVSGKLSVTYSFIVENAGHRDVAVDLSRASFVVPDGDASTPKCSVGGHPTGAFGLVPGKRFRVDCALVLSDRSEKALARGDKDVTLTIPLEAGLDHEGFRFSYLLKYEDME